MKALIVLFVSLVSACAVDAPAEPARYSCLIRFQCANSDDILARQYFTCAGDVDEAKDNTLDASYEVAIDRCGAGNWSWTWATCDEKPVAEAAQQCAPAQ